jgi:hypothetical protein
MASLYEDINRLIEARVEKAHETGELVDLPDGRPRWPRAWPI